MFGPRLFGSFRHALWVCARVHPFRVWCWRRRRSRLVGGRDGAGSDVVGGGGEGGVLVI